MDPQQELFTAIRKALSDIGYDVYDEGLPAAGTPYPFIYLGENTLIDQDNKTSVCGIVSQIVHVWHNEPGQRGQVSEMLLAIKHECRQITRTQNFGWRISSIRQQILPDNTTSEPLLHGVLTVELRFS